LTDELFFFFEGDFMKWLLKSSIAKTLLGSFLIVIVPITLVSLLVNYISMNIVSNEVYATYKNSISLLAGQFGSSLDKYSLMAKNLSIDNDIVAIDQSPSKLETLFEYTDLLKKIKIYSSTNDLSANIMLYMKSKGKLLSSTLGMDTVDNGQFMNDYGKYSNGEWWIKKGKVAYNNSTEEDDV
jgi:hypothetical protein